MSSGRRKREKQEKNEERLKDAQARAARMQNPSGGSKYATKQRVRELQDNEADARDRKSGFSRFNF